ncbi:MAG: hypothetical protein WAJ97_11590 [Terriglobales bacterium]|jgi:hypothetical protein
MLAFHWYRPVLSFLWISPHVLLLAPAVVLWKRRLYCEFPVFFAYVLYEIAEFILLFTLYSLPIVTREQYKYAYCATLMISIVLRFGVIDEVSRGLFRGSQVLRLSARRALQCVTGLLLILGVLLAVYAPGDYSAKWYVGVAVVNRGAAMVQSGLLLALLLYSRFLGLSWRRPALGIALGLAVLTSADLATFALRAAFTSELAKDIVNLLMTGTYFVCVLIWIGYLLLPEPKPASIAVLPHDEVETWNTEFQRLLRAKD